MNPDAGFSPCSTQTNHLSSQNIAAERAAVDFRFRQQIGSIGMLMTR